MIRGLLNAELPNKQVHLSIEDGTAANTCMCYSYSSLTFCSCDLDLDAMTLINELYIDILNTYLHTINEVSRPRLSKMITRNRTDRQTQTDATEHITTRHSWVVIILEVGRLAMFAGTRPLLPVRIRVVAGSGYDV